MNTIDLAIPGFTIAGLSFGNPCNPPILALHGWLDNAHSFKPLAEYLQDQYYLIAVDLPGHGHSSHLPQGYNYHFIDAMLCVVEIIKALNLGKVHLLGHSMGACLASLVAGLTPSLVQSLALIEGLGPFSSPEDTARAQLGAYLKNRQVHAKPSRGYSEEQAIKVRAAKGYVTLEMAEILAQRGLVQSEDRHYWRHDKRLLVPSPLHLTEVQIFSFLKAITAKSCLFWANKGYAFNVELMEARIASVPDLEVIHLEGGHHIHMEHPKPMAEYLRAFFRPTELNTYSE